MRRGGTTHGQLFIWMRSWLRANVAGFEVIGNQKRADNGYCDFLKTQIAVRPDVATAQAMKTLVHELGRSLLYGAPHHAPPSPRATAE